MRISFINFAVGSLAFCLMSGSALAQTTPSATDAQPPVVATSGDAGAAPAPSAAASSAALSPAASPDPSAAAPAVAAPLAPTAPPVVTFENGQLTVIGNNGTLSEILNNIQQKTGAVFESAAGMSTEQVIGQFGPGKPASVIAELLNGTSLNYVLVGSSDGAQLAKVLLSIRPAHVDVQVADEGGSRHHRRGLEALEVQDQPQPDMFQGNAATAPLRRHHRRNGMAAAGDTQSDSTDTTSSDTTAANKTTDGTDPAGDPNATAMNGVGGTGSAPGSPILPPDAPSNIMKAIQHGNGNGGSPTANARNTGFGPTPTGLGAGSGALTPSAGSTYTLPNGATVLGPGIPLPNGAIFFPGGAHMPGH